METRGRSARRATKPVGDRAELVKPIESSPVRREESEAIEPRGSNKAPTEAAKAEENGIGPAQQVVTGPPVQPNETGEQVKKTALPERLSDFGREAFAAVIQSQGAVARGLEALSTEIAGFALSGIGTAAHAATRMLGVKTLSDAIDVNAGFACSSLDAWVGGSAKLSELGVKFVTEASWPFVAQFGRSWSTATRHGS